MTAGQGDVVAYLQGARFVGVNCGDCDKDGGSNAELNSNTVVGLLIEN